jgi:hypothetical protein
MKEETRDPYVVTKDTVIEPPASFRERLRFLGPGFILSASIVGSGELIATTHLGAEAGFVTFWVIIVSCLVKVAVQLEFGKQAIYSGESTMEALNKLPGPRPGKVIWSIWAWLFLMIFKLVQVGGIVGGTALVLNIVFPQISVTIWCFLTAVVVSLIIYRGSYAPKEKISIVMIGLFTLLTIICVVAVQATEFRISRHMSIAICAWAIPLIWATLFLVFQAPAFMVAIGGLATTVILLIVVFAALHFRYRRLPEALLPGRFYDSGFWVSVISILMVALYGLFKLF